MHAKMIRNTGSNPQPATPDVDEMVLPGARPCQGGVAKLAIFGNPRLGNTAKVCIADRFDTVDGILHPEVRKQRASVDEKGRVATASLIVAENDGVERPQHHLGAQDL
jgi:hypothetical protein